MYIWQSRVFHPDDRSIYIVWVAYWNVNVVIWTKFSSLTALEVVIFAHSMQSVTKITFSFQCNIYECWFVPEEYFADTMMSIAIAYTSTMTCTVVSRMIHSLAEDLDTQVPQMEACSERCTVRYMDIKCVDETESTSRLLVSFTMQVKNTQVCHLVWHCYDITKSIGNIACCPLLLTWINFNLGMYQ